MKQILVTGAIGQIGSELVQALRQRYGADKVVATDIRMPADTQLRDGGPFEFLDVLDPHHITRVMSIYEIDRIYHLAAVLSAIGESRPNIAWQINMNGLYNILKQPGSISVRFSSQARSARSAQPRHWTTLRRTRSSVRKRSTA